MRSWQNLVLHFCDTPYLTLPVLEPPAQHEHLKKDARARARARAPTPSIFQKRKEKRFENNETNVIFMLYAV